MMKIFPCVHDSHEGYDYFNFEIASGDLVAISKTGRFSGPDEGCDRYMDTKADNIIRLIEFMKDPESRLPELIIGDLRGPWDFSKRGLVCREGSYLVIDDGHLRIVSLSNLIKTGHLLGDGWKFRVLATRGISYKIRLERFHEILSRRSPVFNRLGFGDLSLDEISQANKQIARRLGNLSPFASQKSRTRTS